MSLKGRISILPDDENVLHLILTSFEGRIFILKGDLVAEVSELFLISQNNDKFTITGTVLHQGFEEIPVELKILESIPIETR